MAPARSLGKRAQALLASLFLLCTHALAADHPAAGGRLELLTLRSQIFSNTRSIRVWLPPGYFDAPQKDTTYPVFYFTDGIATFHGRQLDRIADRLIRARKIPAMIFVGIDNGGSTQESQNPSLDRANEYLPFADEFFHPPLPNPHGQQFPDFLEQEVRPLVESKYRVRSDAIGLAGSSYGALVALYTVMQRPGRYRWLLLESPSLYVSHDELLRRAATFQQWPQRVYVGAGTDEGDGDSKQEMVTDVRRLVKAIPPTVRSCLTIVPGAAHNEDAWRARLPRALEFLLGDRACHQP